MKPLVSVAIAAYNVENCLRNGIKYIQNQTYSNIEIILVDDGSTDETANICDELSKKDSRIHVFHKKNGGLGSARNMGIQNANGKYIYFFDVDDSIEKDFISYSVENAEKKEVDLIIYGYYVKFANSEVEEKIKLNEQEIHNNKELKKVYCEELLWLKHGNGFVWNKFYRLSFIKDNKFTFGNQRIQQDEPFNMQLYPKLKNVYISPNVYYHYVIYNNGNAGSRYIYNKEEIIKDVYHKFLSFYESWELEDKKVWDYIQNRFLSGMFQVATENYFHEKCTLSRPQRYEVIKKTIQDREVIISKAKLRYTKNPINNIQIWSFNQGKIIIFIFVTRLKKWLRRLK